MSFEIKNERIEFMLKMLGERIKSALPKGWGFTLMIFDYGKDGSMFYLSSAHRDDMVKSMEEFIAKQK